MAKIRLTNSIRNSIATAMVAKKFKQVAEDLVLLTANTALLIYKDRYPADQRRLMAKLPEGWLKGHSNIYIHHNGQRDSLSFNGHLPWQGHGSKLMQYIKKDLHTVHMLFPESEKSTVVTGEALQAYKAYRKELERQSDEHYHARSTLDNYLASFTNVEALVEAWPECKPFMPKSQEAAIKIGLPAIPVADLNRMLGIAA